MSIFYTLLTIIMFPIALRVLYSGVVLIAIIFQVAQEGGHDDD